jgi:hypothetical protein
MRADRKAKRFLDEARHAVAQLAWTSANLGFHGNQAQSELAATQQEPRWLLPLATKAEPTDSP